MDWGTRTEGRGGRGREREGEKGRADRQTPLGTDSGQLCAEGNVSLAGTRAWLSHVTAGRFLNLPRLHSPYL